MPTEQLTYAQIAERLSVSPEAARAIVKRHRLPRSRRNDGKTLAAVDLEEIRHTPMPARSPRGRRSVTDVVATLKARVAGLETELAQAEERSAGHRVDFERERERADQLVTTQDRMVAELEALHSLLRSLLEAAHQVAPPVTSRNPDMARREMARDDSLAQSMRSLLEAAQAARLEAAQRAARPVTSRTWREMTWSERWRRLRRTG
jgi:chromosome segregation ATPase